MTLDEILNLAPEEQEIVLIPYDGGFLRAKAETLSAVLAGDALNRKLINIKAIESTLWVWLELE